MRLKLISTLAMAALASFGVTAAQSAWAQPADASNGQPSQPIRSQFVHWAKVRLDEIDATLASLDGQVAKLQGDARIKAESTLANMRARRDAFRETLQKATERIETDWNGEKVAREADWKAFEASAEQFIDDAKTQIQGQKATFEARAAAQKMAWQEAIDKLEHDAGKVAADNKAKAEAAVKQIKADAAAARAKLEKLTSASAASWSAYEKALEETRSVFDRATQTAHSAFTK